VSKVVIFELGEGDFDRGFSVTLQIGEEGKHPSVEIRGRLPPNTEVYQQYQCWQSAYRNLESRYRLSAKDDKPTRGSFLKDCNQAAAQLKTSLEFWLESSSLDLIRRKFVGRVQESEDVRVLIQTDNVQLQRLPWHLWSLFAPYSRAEVAVISPSFDSIQKSRAKPKLRILAVLGNSDGIDTQADAVLLKQLLPAADIQFLPQARHQELTCQALTEQLWNPQGWDVLFFAGHSSSQIDGESGWIQINQTDTLTIQELKKSLGKAIENGLKLAIFNSCDGLGLARALADLQMPQVIVMRELVPDKVANAFLGYFLEAFVRGEPLYYAVKEAREKLEGLEPEFPCATWLPIIYQNSSETPPTIGDWIEQPQEKPKRHLKWSTALAVSLTMASLTIGTRLLGLWQWADLQAYDHLLRLRKADGFDPIIFVIRITLDDQDSENKTALKNKTWFALFTKLKQAQMIGLDIPRNGLNGKEKEEWINFLKKNQDINIYGICERPNSKNENGEILSPGLDQNDKYGFSNVEEDWSIDNVLRRQILSKSLDVTVTSNQKKQIDICPTEYSLSFAMATDYLTKIPEKYEVKAIDQEWHLGNTTFKHLESRYGGYQGITPDGHQILLKYRNPLEVGQSATVKEVVTNYAPAFFKDKIVLIGADNPREDRFFTPYKRDIAGVFIHAQVLSYLLDVVTGVRSQLWVWSPEVEAIWILGWALVGGVFVWWIRSPLIIIGFGGILLGVLYSGCFFVLQYHSGWIPLLPSATAFILTTGSLAMYTATQTKQL